MTPTQNRCGIYIDIEGTSNIYKNNENQYYRALDCLLSSALKITNIQFPTDNHRLLLHQMGADGLFIISDFGYESLQIPISISIYLMQQLLLCGSVGKCGISIGNNFDIRSCLPITEDLTKSQVSQPNSGGFITRVNIMGSALINSYRVANCEPNGSRIAVDRLIESSISIHTNIIQFDRKEEIIVTDWIHSESEILDYIYSSINEHKLNITKLEDHLKSYIRTNDRFLKKRWIENTLLLNGCK